MAYRIVAKSPKHLNDIVEDIMSWFETAREYRTQFDTESIKFADPVTKQVSGFRDIDVLHVQDITTGKKTVIKFIPLIRPEEMKIVMGGENEHVMKGKIKNMMKGRGEFKTYNKDTLRKMSESDATTLLKQLGQELKSHDWNYQYSDDPKYYDRGSREWESIRNIISQINKMGLQTDGEAIWKQFASSDQKNNYPDKLRESKMKISEFKKMIREEIQNVLKEAKGLAPEQREQLKKLLADLANKLKSGTPLDPADYANVKKFKEALWQEPDPMIKTYFNFEDSNGEDISTQKRSVTMLRKLVDPALSSQSAKKLSAKDKDYLNDTIASIAAGLADGDDMTDDIVDELSDSYDAVYATRDAKLIKAYDDLRNAADMGIAAQKKATIAMLKILK